MCYHTDDGFPPNDGDEWIIVREMGDLVNVTFPVDFISFDHDLGDGKATGFDIAKHLVERELDGDAIFSKTFTFYVHSQNPVGKSNIESFLKNYLDFRDT